MFKSQPYVQIAIDATIIINERILSALIMIPCTNTYGYYNVCVTTVHMEVRLTSKSSGDCKVGRSTFKDRKIFLSFLVY